MLGKKIIIKQHVENKKVFEEFRESWIRRTRMFSNFNELVDAKLNYDAVIVGSDQVWRPKMFTCLADYKVYFLGFLPESVKKISYAASFGVDNWEIDDATITSEIKKYINEFSAVSVREQSGKEICNSMFDIDATHVLDPTLLIGKDFFEKIIAKENINTGCQKQIVYYKLDVDNTFLTNIKKLGMEFNKPVINIYYTTTNNNYEYYSVGTWLNNIKTGDLVVTDSFHCVCFSILFHKEFLCCINEARGLSRLKSLLSDLGLDERICFSNDDFVSKINSLNSIDYVNVEKRLLEKRTISKQYLLASLASD